MGFIMLRASDFMGYKFRMNKIMTIEEDRIAFRYEVEAFLVRAGCADYKLGKDVINDTHFVSDMRRGERQISRRTMKKVRDWMKAAK